MRVGTALLSRSFVTHSYSIVLCCVESWAALDTLLHGKDPASTPVYMYCTGGIRCEKVRPP